MLQVEAPVMSDLFRDALMGTLHEGGATFDKDGHALAETEGFVVGGLITAAVIPLEMFTVKVFAAVVDALTGRPLQDGEYVGTWTDGGLVYVEISEHVVDEGHARELGRQRGEKAIFDLARGVTIFLD